MLKLFGTILMIFFWLVIIVVIVIVFVCGEITSSFKNATSGNKRNNDTFNHSYTKQGTNQQARQTNSTIIDAEIVTDSILNKYISDINEINKTVNNDIQNLLNELVVAMQNMNDYILNHRDKEEDIRIMAEYYIPEMIHNLKTYKEMATSNFKSQHEEEIKQSVMEAIKMITDAFNTVLSEFYDDMALNVSASLDALKTKIKLKHSPDNFGKT